MADFDGRRLDPGCQFWLARAVHPMIEPTFDDVIAAVWPRTGHRPMGAVTWAAAQNGESIWLVEALDGQPHARGYVRGIRRASAKPTDTYWIVNGQGERIGDAGATIGVAVRCARQVARGLGARVYLMTRIKGRVRMVAPLD